MGQASLDHRVQACPDTADEIRSGCEDLSFAGARLHLDARRALWWPERQLLVIADIHFEKAKAFAEGYDLLPPHDTRDNLARLAGLIDDYRPHTLICLGDSFHRDYSAERLPEPEARLLAGIVERVPDWRWIVGNHDRVTHLPFAGSISTEERIGPLTFLHGDGELPDEPCVLGHFHPKDRIRLRGHKVEGPCFMWSKTRLILPAFGTMTGGLDLRSAALRAVIGDTPCVGLIHRGTIGCYRKR